MDSIIVVVTEKYLKLFFFWFLDFSRSQLKY